VPLALLFACGPKRVPLPVVSTPRFPTYVAPAVPPAFSASDAAELQNRGWTFLQAGDLKNAEREFAASLKTTPAFYPAEVGLGYVQLAARDAKGALAHFDRVLEQVPADPSALVGRGEADLVLGREPEALAAFEAAAAANPALTDVARRVEVLKFRNAEQQIADARAAGAAGRLDDAVARYEQAIASSPGSAFLYRELAGIERKKGDATAALQYYRKAIEVDPGDAASHVGMGELLEAGGDLDAAAAAYTDALALDRGPEVEAKLAAVRARAELARLPAQYRAIDTAPEITRGDLAALIGVRLAPLLQPDAQADAEPITDVRADWAAPWILTVARAGVMAPFSNHAFQPRSPVHRIDLAQAVERLLALIAPRNPVAARNWESARLTFTDLAPGHLAYPAASAAVASGVLTAGADGSFDPSRVVTGEEAVETMVRLQALADLPSPGAVAR
jgi:tetratricopeptide (TPR) repeat protein